MQQSVKYECKREWNNFRNNFYCLPMFQCTYTIVKRQVENCLFANIESIFNFCVLPYCFIIQFFNVFLFLFLFLPYYIASFSNIFCLHIRFFLNYHRFYDCFMLIKFELTSYRRHHSLILFIFISILSETLISLSQTSQLVKRSCNVDYGHS